MKVLALDIATQMGVAVGESGESPVAWSVDLGKGCSEDARFSTALQISAALVKDHAPGLVAIEAPIGGPKTSHYLVGLVACVRGVCANRGITILMCDIGSVRKHFTGRAWTARDFPRLTKAKAKEAIKGKVLERCRLLKWQVPDHDAADAAATWDFACATMGAMTAPGGQLFHA